MFLNNRTVDVNIENRDANRIGLIPTDGATAAVTISNPEKRNEVNARRDTAVFILLFLVVISGC